jgi:hypothetical protein
MGEDWTFKMGGRRLLGHSILVVVMLRSVLGLETCSKWGRQAGMGEDFPLWTLAWGTGAGTIDLGGDRVLPSVTIASVRTFEL